MKALEPSDKARQAIREMIDAGAVFNPIAQRDGRGPSFTYELAPGGDRARCRAILQAAKSDTAVWRELVAVVTSEAAA